jgi:hypothetical protein
MPAVTERLRNAAFSIHGHGQTHMRVTLTDEIIQLAVDRQRPVQVLDRLAQPTEFGVCAAEAAVNAGLRGRFAQPLRRAQRDGLDGDVAVPVSSPVQEIDQGPGELSGIKVQSSGSAGGDRVLEPLALDFEPGQRLAMV